ncbi:MAG: hypothetical protein FWH42_05960 [Dehalococcoidia bacterium]|nr:hypothetical protein [Dehalococcoidia bacterium]
MKKLITACLCILFVGLCACEPAISRETQTVTTSQEAADVTTTWAISDASTPTTQANKTSDNKPYSDELNKIIKAHDDHPDGLKNVQYTFYDLDGNGTQELLIGIVAWGLANVYAYQNGVAVRQEEFFIDPAEVSPPILLKNGAIKLEWDTYGAPRVAYYRFIDGVLKRQITLLDDFGQYYRYDMYVDQFPGASITKEEFDRVQKEMEGDGQVVELDWKPLAEWGQ